MRRIIFLLLLLPLVSTGQVKLSQFPVASSADSTDKVAGVRYVGGHYTNYLYSMHDLAVYIGSVGTSDNFANANLTLTGNRSHDFADYNMRWNNVGSFNYVDTAGDSIISINTFTLPSNNMVRLSSEGQILLNDKTAYSGLSINKPVTRMFTGSCIFQTQDAGASGTFSRILTDTVISFKSDSATRKTKIGNVNADSKCVTITWDDGSVMFNNAYTFPITAAANTNMHFTSTAGNLDWEYVHDEFPSSPTDANYVLSNVNTYIKLPVVTADRTVTLPTGVNGTRVTIVNLNTSGTYHWSFVGTVKDAGGATITTLTNGTCYQLEYEGSSTWRKIN